MRKNTVKAKLRQGEVSLGTWLTLGSPSVARFLARSGFDWLTIDMEHSPTNSDTAAMMLGQIADAGCVPLVRVPGHQAEAIKCALDSGSFGVVVPMVNTPDQASAVTAACHYPPAGIRSVGGSLHALNWQTTPAVYHQQANEEVLVILQCEHRLAVENFEAIFANRGVDVVFVGPHDLAASYRTADGKTLTTADMAQTLQTILQHCQRLGLVPGIHAANATEAKQRIAEGWRFIAIGSDLKMMVEQASRTMAEATGQVATNELVRY